MNHANSIQTQYYDDPDMQQNMGFYQHSIHGQSFKKDIGTEGSNVVASRIESNIKDYHQQLKNNKNIINQLQCQRKFFQKLSKKQQDKISQMDTQKIKSSYEQRIFHIKQQTSQFHQVIANFNQQQQQAQRSFIQTHSKIVANKQFLMETLIQLEKENEELMMEIVAQEKEMMELETLMGENQNSIREKEAAHRRYVELQIEIERLEKQIPHKYNA